MLSPRADIVLKSIVAQYIERAVPVSSQGILDFTGLGVSSATIRNDMMELEHEGYILRPHTSAGAVPSDNGYRYYVESLKRVSLPSAEQFLIGHLFHQVEWKLEEWLRLTVSLIARLVHNVAVATMPKPVDCWLKHIELVALQDSLALVIMVLHGVKVRQELINFDETMSQFELTKIANKLNAVYADLTKAQIEAKDVYLSPPEQRVTGALLQMMKAEDVQKYAEPYFDGWQYMLDQPEFAQSRHVMALMELAEGRRLLEAIIPRRVSDRGLQVIIGKENPEKVFQNYSVVINQYGLQGKALGTVSIIGPTRMPYARTIATLEYLSSVLDRLVAELYGEKGSQD